VLGGGLAAAAVVGVEFQNTRTASLGICAISTSVARSSRREPVIIAVCRSPSVRTSKSCTLSFESSRRASSRGAICRTFGGSFGLSILNAAPSGVST
jgi:hypothetical protein